ncbi:MAG TPA: universal stress protein [Methylomirabilota bacterium]|nr:universal stress protein [Methylomirabilota bacterium]
MSLKDLLVIVDNDPACAERLDVTRRLAEAHGAHVTGLHVMHYPVALYTEIPVPEAVEKMQRAEIEQIAMRAGTLFQERMRGATARHEWRVLEGPLGIVATEQARYADLTVLPQGLDLGMAPGGLGSLPADMALAAGRPVLVVPRYGKFPTVGTNVLVAWNGSREATRAVHDALPLLRIAEKVTVVSFDPEHPESSVPGGGIARHLTRHGVTVTATSLPGANIAVGDLLLSYAADHGVDLIVMGAYGHTRLRELVLGGATRALLQHMTVPVFMSH